jgi:hypothetical protein
MTERKQLLITDYYCGNCRNVASLDGNRLCEFCRRGQQPPTIDNPLPGLPIVGLSLMGLAILIAAVVWAWSLN